MAGGEHKQNKKFGRGGGGRNICREVTWGGYTSLLFRNSKQWLVVIMNIMGTVVFYGRLFVDMYNTYSAKLVGCEFTQFIYRLWVRAS